MGTNAIDTRASGDGRAHARVRDTWALRWADGGRLVATYAALTAAFVGIGLLLTHPLKASALVRLDGRIERWFVPRRTSTWNSLSWLGSQLSETTTKVVVTAIVCIVLLLVYRRWYEALLVAVPLIVEAAAFLTITVIVGRPRPDVPRLDGSPVGSSFPSGHTAAAACYAGVVVVLFLHTHRRWLRGSAVAAVIAVTAIVGVARMYRGMHHLTDVVAGALLGTLSVLFCVAIVQRAQRVHDAPRPRRTSTRPAR